MADDFNPIKYFTEIGGVFKFGSGVLGKSAIAVGIFLLAIPVAVWRLHSDLAVLGALVFGALIFLLWFFSVLRFANQHPDLALLDGAEWTGWKKFEAAAKGSAPTAEQLKITSAPGTFSLDATKSERPRE